MDIKKNTYFAIKQNTACQIQISPPKNLLFQPKGKHHPIPLVVPEKEEEAKVTRDIKGYSQEKKKGNVSPPRRPHRVYMRPLWPHDRDGRVVRQGEGDGGEVRVCAEVSCDG